MLHWLHYTTIKFSIISQSFKLDEPKKNITDNKNSILYRENRLNER